MKKINTAPKILLAEKHALTQFLLECAEVADPSIYLSTQKVFSAYREWRKKSGLDDTELSLGGFGKIFPPTFSRKCLYWPPIQRPLNCVVGIKLKC